jgi:hypothetical protein
MKKYYLLLAVLFLGAVCLSSCGDDDPEEIIENIVDGKTKPTVSINTAGNPMTMTITYKGLYTQTHAATFGDDGMCSNYTITEKFENSKLADEAWNAYQLSAEKDQYKRSGNTITSDQTEAFAGYTREYMMLYFNTLKTNLEKTS